ncbi:MAG: C45 family autoproteolytic acyltransferase/hydrolase [Clostridia bacterium]|nr:C45 family autoproteolytic acyltransferase/hydrolase [Clostridia bacterium]
MLKRVISILFIMLFLAAQFGCSTTKEVSTQSSFNEKGVAIIDKGNYYAVTLDFNSGMNHRQIGEAFARGICQMVPNYEELVDSYIAENLNENQYSGIFSRVKDIKPQINQDYRDEIEGMASVFSGGDKNIENDKKLSKDELYLFNLFADCARDTQCSFVSVFGSRSSTHSTLTARNLDWYGGSANQLPKIQAVITLKYPDKKLCLIGYMGFMGILTGFNDSGVFAAIMDSQSGAPYSSGGKHSYPLDLRNALEKYKTLNDAAEFMKGNANNFTVNHLIAFSDKKESKVLENNFSGKGANGEKVQCALRSYDSRLNKGVEWGISDAMASVNSFILYGNTDNHTVLELNTKRWENIKEQLLAKGTSVTPESLKEVISYDGGSPGTFSDSGDVYNRMTLQMVLFQPENFSLEVFFRPKDNRKNPDHPVFEKIAVFQ